MLPESQISSASPASVAPQAETPPVQPDPVMTQTTTEKNSETSEENKIWEEIAPLYHGDCQGKVIWLLEQESKTVKNIFEILQIEHERINRESFIKYLETLPGKDLKEIAPDIKSKFLNKELLFLLIEDTIKTKIDKGELTEKDQTDLTNYCEDPQTLNNYMQQLKLNADLQPGIFSILMYAKYIGVRINIWRTNSSEKNSVELIGSHTSEKSEGEVINILYKNSNFILLQLAEVKQSQKTVTEIKTATAGLGFFMNSEAIAKMTMRTEEQKREERIQINQIALQVIPLRRYYADASSKKINLENLADLDVYIDACFFRLLRFGRAVSNFIAGTNSNERPFKNFSGKVIHAALMLQIDKRKQQSAIANIIESIKKDFLAKLLPKDEVSKVDDPSGLLAKCSQTAYQEASNSLNLTKTNLFRMLNALCKDEARNFDDNLGFQLINDQLNSLPDYTAFVKKHLDAREDLHMVMLAYPEKIDACAMKIVNIGESWAKLCKNYLVQVLNINLSKLTKETRAEKLKLASHKLQEKYNLSNKLVKFLNTSTVAYRNVYGHPLGVGSEPNILFLQFVFASLKENHSKEINELIQTHFQEKKAANEPPKPIGMTI